MQGSPNFWLIGLYMTGLLLFVIAAGSLFTGKDSAKKRQLGCGFGLMAGAVWTFALQQATGSWIDAARLAGGFVLVLGLIHAFRAEGGARPVRAAGFFIAAFMLAAPVLYKMVARVVPTEENRRTGGLEERVQDVRDRLSAIDAELVDLQSRRAEVRADIAGLGHDSFDALRADPKGVPLLRELAKVDETIAAAQNSANALREALPQLEEQLRRATSGGASVGEGVATSDGAGSASDALGGDYEREAVRTIEELAAEEELRDLFESEFP